MVPRVDVTAAPAAKAGEAIPKTKVEAAARVVNLPSPPAPTFPRILLVVVGVPTSSIILEGVGTTVREKAAGERVMIPFSPATEGWIVSSSLEIKAAAREINPASLSATVERAVCCSGIFVFLLVKRGVIRRIPRDALLKGDLGKLTNLLLLVGVKRDPRIG